MKLEEINNLLKNYEIGNLISIKKDSIGLESKILFFHTSQGSYVIKIKPFLALSDIEYELDLISNINQKGLPIPEIIKTNNNDKLVKFRKGHAFYKYIEGINPIDINKNLTLKLTKSLAQLDYILLNLNFEQRPGWQIFDIAIEKVFAEKNDFLIKYEDLYEKFKKIKLYELRKCIIHADYRSVNLIINNDDLAGIIDFGDAHYDYLILDLANAMLGCLLNSNNRFNFSLLRIVVKEYEKTIKLNYEEKKALYYFFKLRILLVINFYLTALQTKALDVVVCEHAIKDLKIFLKSIEKINFEDFFNEIK